MNNLALEVGLLDNVVVDHRDRPDTGRREIGQHRGSQPARPEDKNPRTEEPLLALEAELGQHDVPGVAAQLRRRERTRRAGQRWIGHGGEGTQP